MNVVHLFKDYFPPTTGGIEQHMQLLCTGLAKRRVCWKGTVDCCEALEGLMKHALAVTSLLAAACSSTPSGPNAGQVLGTPLPAHNATRLLWSANGTEIIYVQASNLAGVMDSIQAVTLSNGHIRSILADTESLGELRLSSDGSRLYYTALPHLVGDGTLRRVGVDGQGAAVLADSLGSGYAAVEASGSLWFAASPVGPYVAYGQLDDSLHALNDSAGSRVAVGAGAPITFSPDGLQILYSGSCNGNPGTCTVSRGGGSSQSVALDLTGAYEVRWDVQGVKVLFDSFGTRFYVTNVTAGTSTSLWSVAPGTEFPITYGFAWSPDGTTVALWGTLCLTTTCPALPLRLHLLDVATGRDRILAQVSNATSTCPIGTADPLLATAFSRDSKRIAYQVCGVIYYQTL